MTETSTNNLPDLKTPLVEAEACKQEGNIHFRASRWPDALTAYQSGLALLPKKPRNERSSSEPTPLDEVASNDGDASPAHQSEPIELTKMRAVLHANVGACYVKLGEHEEVVKACSKALADDPKYVKALQRRAASNEKINSWSSLTAAQTDYKTLLEILPASSPLTHDANMALRSIKPRVEAAQKRETEEMLGKLKGLGNSILGNFGLSTDNFKFEPNGQGGYSVNFRQ